ncbi:hypothetical protein FS837_010288 [Tulasnella sp. UAMH 9824]|nr:hypothetical protein FS837_010288 [Tulasnella sp. UAMH 9824]
MRSLSLRGRGQLISTHPLRTPHLTELQLINCSIIWNPLHNLRSLSVNRVRDMTLAHLIQTMQSSPLLEQLHLRNVETPPEDLSNKAVIPLTPVHLPQLSILRISKVSPSLASGILERLVLSTTCRPYKVHLVVDHGLDLSDFCRHAGQICARGFTEETTNLHLRLNPNSLTLTLTPDMCLYIQRKLVGHQQHAAWKGTEYARHFFEGVRGMSSRVSPGTFSLRVGSEKEVAGGLAMVQEFFPKTVELEVATWEGLEALEVLAEPMADEEGHPVWRLPNLKVLKLRMLQEKYSTGTFDYGRIVAMAIKRTQVAVSSPSELTPITLLTLRNGFILYELLAKLEEAGINYERDGVMAIQSFQDLIWERSGDAALEVDVSRGRSHYGSAWTESEVAFLGRVITRNIRELRAEVPATENLDPYIVNWKHPRTTSLSLHGGGQLICTRSPCTPQLAEIHLVWCSIPWNGLYNLRSLSIVLNAGPNLAELVHILQSSPLLEQLNLSHISISPEDPSDEAVTPVTPINLSQLSRITIHEISFKLTSGLLKRLYPSRMCRVSTFEVLMEDEVDLPAICHQAGRICAPRGLPGQIIDPQLHIQKYSLQIQAGPNRWLAIENSSGGWNLEEQSTKLARIFFEASNAVSIKTPVTRFCLRPDSMPNALRGLTIANQCFPEIVELDIALSIKMDLEALEALAEPTTDEGNSYDGTIAMAIKRTRAAASSNQAVSAITLLDLSDGWAYSKSLERLAQAGINDGLPFLRIALMDPAVASLAKVFDCDSAIAHYEARIIQIKRRRNSLLPISRLHRELLHYILHLALSDDWDGSREPAPPPPFRYYSSLFVLRRVSHKWENEIANTPLFWTLFSRLLKKPMRGLIWERSGAAVLDVDVSRDPRRVTGSGFGNPFWSLTEQLYLARIRKREIRQLRALVPKAENLDAYLANRHHPRMKVLSLYGEHQVVCTRPLQVPQLEELYITHCKIIWDNLQNLRVLSVAMSDGPNLAQLVHILQSSPQLERLSLRNIKAASDGAAVPLNLIYLCHLSKITFDFISLDIASGLLERLLTSAACRVSEMSWLLSEGPSSSGFFHQAGRICTPQGPEEQIIDPQLSLIYGELHLETAPGRHLRTLGFNSGTAKQQSIMQQVADAARTFFDTSRRLPVRVRSSRFRLQLRYMSHVAGGLGIVQELFPDTVELDVSCKEGLKGLEVLAQPIIEDGDPVWLLPKLAVLKLNTTNGEFDYGGIIAMAIKRTQAATTSPSALSPIALLSLATGSSTLSSLVGWRKRVSRMSKTALQL